MVRANLTWKARSEGILYCLLVDCNMQKLFPALIKDNIGEAPLTVSQRDRPKM